MAGAGLAQIPRFSSRTAEKCHSQRDNQASEVPERGGEILRESLRRVEETTGCDNGHARDGGARGSEPAIDTTVNIAYDSKCGWVALKV
jgi:hypothetical protein